MEEGRKYHVIECLCGGSLTDGISRKRSLKLHEVGEDVELSLVNEEVLFCFDSDIHVLHVRRANELFGDLSEITVDLSEADVWSDERVSSEKRFNVS